MNELSTRTAARLAGHPGELVRASGRTLVWQGPMTPDLLSDLLRAGSEGAVRVQRDRGSDHAAWIQRCWFDLERGRMVVHLLDRRMTA